MDTTSQARRVFVENLTGMLQVIAKDAKVQVEFNPGVVSRYRLIGYENRRVADQDFRVDTIRRRRGGRRTFGNRIVRVEVP